ncbi:MAG: zeta toxin family protein [Candidatus Thiodiazotropha sp. (ex Ctena orbiculata)]|nr:zeta toxin family protein [Candidatus Thiodiazotropha taylori]MBT2995859.1 zeta toxin family protein [Candidatus Thiodiazotropha taylori]MBT2999174.1 zeta toxin family protein [Candidatus Thiodiazotropha taylori]MBV2105653.1 zeta toxin family protein [Candidatus Thiodiazotropha taylori]MBV2112246.1 zeta toxin family protein [Candidatus Thiodiazotropha taylori]
MSSGEVKYGPWNPGILSPMPEGVKPFMTIARAENVFQSVSELEEISGFTGFPWECIATFRPQRLAVHELLIRISANLSVSDGIRYEDLGVNFRSMARLLFERYVSPNLQQINNLYDELRREIEAAVEEELEASLFAQDQESVEPKGWLNKLFRRQHQTPPTLPGEVRELQIITAWKEEASRQKDNPLRRAILQSLYRITNAIMIRHGRIRGEKDLLVKLVVGEVCNAYGSRQIGNLIEPMIETGAAAAGYSTLPIQEHPVIMNVKGASASGKSTLRPLQHQLANRLGFRWEEFALISPDIWRKYLLDYDSMGELYKYAAVCTGHELKIVDKKLDAYMARKAKRVGVSHLLIDRFRFDSFAERSTKKGSNLLTRFGSKVFMFFMITPPHDTVERAWERGEQVGRYKAVDDLLDHNVEAFTGISQIFFTWALDQDKDIHYEFLDNSVDFGERPRTVAYGENGSLCILCVKCMIDIDRYKKININADSVSSVYPSTREMAPEMNLAFLKACIERLENVEFVNPKNRKVAARIRRGELVELSMMELEEAVPDADTREVLLKLISPAKESRDVAISMPDLVDISRSETLGDCYG